VTALLMKNHLALIQYLIHIKARHNNTFSYGHINGKAQVPVRSPKISPFEQRQYYGWRQHGNTLYCNFFSQDSETLRIRVRKKHRVPVGSTKSIQLVQILQIPKKLKETSQGFLVDKDKNDHYYVLSLFVF
jgi:hypothetical protein